MGPTMTDAWGAAAAPPPPMVPNRKRTHEDNNTPVAAAGFPQPKWPEGHESAAFEAVAIKKSTNLSPPEIYAEIAHHGKVTCQPFAQQAMGM